MNYKKLGVLALLIVGVAVIWGPPFLRWFKPTVDDNYVGGPPPILYCENCSRMFRSDPRILTPVHCPKCGKETAYQAEYYQCQLCQQFLPTAFYSWSSAEKTKWQAKFKKGLSPSEFDDLYRAQQGKRPGGEWMPALEVSAHPFQMVCPKCGNKDAAQFRLYPAAPPVEEPKK